MIMKSLRNIFVMILSLTVWSCSDLDLNPLSEGSSETWFSNDVEINMSLNDLYKPAFWPVDPTDWTDDWINREVLTPITSATINGEWATVASRWNAHYQAVSRANAVINALETKEVPLVDEVKERYIAEARFVRAYQYSRLISYFGDVVYYTQTIPLEEAYKTGRTPKSQVLNAIYEDFDYAIARLPESYPATSPTRGTKGAALAFKARIALYNQDWEIARDAAKALIDMGTYSLHPDFGELFLSSTRRVPEIVHSIARSATLGVSENIRAYLPRNNGGWGGQFGPSWSLLGSFLCTDGLPVDESPLFDPRDPFKNRDPRCSYTIVPFQSAFLGFIYQPHPDSLEILNLNTGRYQVNNDTRGNQQFASFNGLILKKGVDETWADDFLNDSDIIVMRYADVLLMYAEAKIELGEIDDSVLEAMNRVRARAYKVDYKATSQYPAITTTDRDELRSILRFERRMEFAFEGTRYMDLIRWRVAEKALNMPNYGLLDPDELRAKVTSKGLWFFPEVPAVDENAVVDFTGLGQKGLAKLLTNGQFDASRQYLWPIPSKEVLINENMDQNPGY